MRKEQATTPKKKPARRTPHKNTHITEGIAESTPIALGLLTVCTRERLLKYCAGGNSTGIYIY
jgi:hypothetical protein